MNAFLTYFAYGSNMSSARLRERVPAARSLGLARLADWRLCLDKHGRDGTAKANIRPSRGSEVWGVAYRLPLEQKEPLDHAESLGVGYAESRVRVCLGVSRQAGTLAGTDTGAFTYVAVRIREGLPVASWYLDHLIRGCVEHCVPEAHVRLIHGLASALPDSPAMR